jgi:lysophospholipase L1-like esterase
VALDGRSSPTPASSAFFLHPRDVVVFLGDSITENGRYIGYLEEYVHNYQRGYQVQFVNAGWGGDRVKFGQKEGGSPGALGRVERDVLAHHPTVVVILLGMNDGRSTDPGRLKEFRQGMEELIRRVRRGSTARIVLLSGTPYDTTRRPGEDPALGENVSRFAQAVREIGQAHGVMVIDLHDPLLHLVRACRERRPPIALIPDGVHPETPGHLAIASLILRAWHAPIAPRALTLTATGSVARQTGAELRACRRRQDSLRFERRLSALPIAIPENVRRVLAGDTTVQQLCADTLVVRHLPAARYELRVDGRPRAVLSREQLERGTDLSRLSSLPDVEQARRVADLAQSALGLRNAAWLAEQRRVAISVAAPPPSLRRRLWDRLRALGGASPSAAAPPSPPAPKVPVDWKERLARLDQQWRAAAVPRWHQFTLTPVRR